MKNMYKDEIGTTRITKLGDWLEICGFDIVRAMRKRLTINTRSYNAVFEAVLTSRELLRTQVTAWKGCPTLSPKQTTS